METEHDPRFVSRLTRQTIALVLAGGRGSRQRELTDWRAKPAVYFGGKFRIIDFPLSNCVNSGVRRIAVLTQYKAHSLIQHLVRGWSHFRNELGEFVDILPASQRIGGEWYKGTADAIYQNLDIIRTHSPDFVLILAGDHIYKMDYGAMLARHVESQADMTISCLEVPVEEAAGAFGVMIADADGRIRGFEEKPANPTPIPGKPGYCLASMGNYVVNTGFLYQELSRDAYLSSSGHDFGNDIIPAIIEGNRVFAYPFRDPATGREAYWRDVGTIDAYWDANMELVAVEPELDIYDSDWPILTHQGKFPPAKVVSDRDGHRATVVDSVMSGGCVISGADLERTLLFSNVRVHSYVSLNDTVVLPEVEVHRHARIRRAVIDRGCVIPEGMVIGEDHEEDRRRGFRVSEKGIVLVTPDMLGQNIHRAG